MTFDTSMYTVVRGEALMRSKGKEPPSTWYITDKDGNLTDRKYSIGTHPHGISAGVPVAPHKTLDAAKWVALAQASDDERPVLQQLWYQTQSNVAADGYRIHAVEGERVATAVEWVQTWEKQTVPDYLGLFASDARTPYRFSVRTDALWRALHAVKPFARDSSNIVRFEAQAGALVVRATSAEYGDASATIDGTDYAPGAQYPSEFALNCKYALDALRGMGERTEISTHSQYGQQPFVFASSNRRALVMPMHLTGEYSDRAKRFRRDRENDTRVASAPAASRRTQRRARAGNGRSTSTVPRLDSHVGAAGGSSRRANAD